MQRVMITGAGGFVGRHVVAALGDDFEIVTPHQGNCRVNLLDPGAPRKVVERAKPDLLIHLAWETEHGRFWTAPSNTLWQTASSELFQAFFECGGVRAVGLGSCAEYDWTNGSGIFAEDAPLAPHTPYGVAKVATSNILREAAQRHSRSHAWGRVFFSFGIGEPTGRLIPLMLKAVLDQTPLDIGPASTVRDFWDVRDLGASIAALALSDVSGPVNLGSGEGISFGDLARMIESIAGVDNLIHPDRRPLGAGEPVSLVPDISKLRRDVSLKPQYNMHRAITEYLRAFRQG
ncbi:MAG: NAD(P)-dependent oxidoreductase [Pseudomonadota bacterium]